jgi:hypothetical protein
MIELRINVTESGQRPRIPTAEAITKVAAQAAYNELQAHFAARDAQGNAKGWPSSGLWGQISMAMAVETEGARAGVAIDDVRFWRKLLGGPPITPKRGKFLTIPASAEAYAAGSPGEGGTPELKRMLAYNPDIDHWMWALVAAGDYQRTVTRGKNAGATVRAKTGQKATLGMGTIWYWLARQTNPPADPRAMPEPAVLEAAIATSAERFLQTFGAVA